MPDKPSAHFRNLGCLRFENDAEQVGLTATGCAWSQNNWLSVVCDGDLDIYGPHGQEPRIPQRRWFVQPDPRGSSPIRSKSAARSCWLDYDEDGDRDLFLANQSGKTDTLDRYDNGIFTDVAPALGMDVPGRAKDEGGRDCAVGDFDNDDHFDIFEPNYGKNVPCATTTRAGSRT